MTADGTTWGGAGFRFNVDWSTMTPQQLNAYPEYNAAPFYRPLRAATLRLEVTRHLWNDPALVPIGLERPVGHTSDEDKPVLGVARRT